MAIEAILWDVDGTLLDFLAAEEAAIQACFAHFGLGRCAPEQLERYSALNRRYWQRLERGELTKQQVLEGRFRAFFSQEGIDPELAVPFNELYQQRLGDTVCFLDQSDQLVRRLRGRVRQYAATNGTRAARGWISCWTGCLSPSWWGRKSPPPSFSSGCWTPSAPWSPAGC